YLTPVFITSSRATPTLPSFPTRRSSDLAGSLLQQDRADAFLRQAERRRQAADAAAGDQYRSDVHQPDFPRCSSASSARSGTRDEDRKSTRLNSSHDQISYAVFCLKKKKY